MVHQKKFWDRDKTKNLAGLGIYPGSYSPDSVCHVAAILGLEHSNTITIILAVVVVLDAIHIMYILNKNKGNE